MRTVRGTGEAKLVRERSRFLAFVYPVCEVAEAEGILAVLRRRYHDARHIVHAYRILGENGIRERADDAGEPSRSAGWPILELLRGRELVNVLVVVVRYFGGVKLGVGGLRRAYRDAAAAALEDAGLTEFAPRAVIRVACAPADSGRAFSSLSRLGVRVLSQGFAAGKVVLTVEVPRDRVEEVAAALAPWAEVTAVE